MRIAWSMITVAFTLTWSACQTDSPSDGGIDLSGGVACSAARPNCSPDAGRCDGDLGVCHGCDSDSECPSAAPRCDRPNERCVSCLPQDDNCVPGTYCAATTDGGYACIPGCKDSNDCNRSDAGGSRGYECCANRCVNLEADKSNCGACGRDCGQSTCCQGACTDVTNDPRNCGGCGIVCQPQANEIPACMDSKCGPRVCNVGYADCNGAAVDGCEVHLLTDSNHCGGCAQTCVLPNAIPDCSAGQCMVAVCHPGFANCNQDPYDGCEVNLLTDPRNCGACARSCAEDVNGQLCVSGTCVGRVAGDCDSNIANQCLATQRRGCEGGRACGAGSLCVPGKDCGATDGLVCRADSAYASGSCANAQDGQTRH